MFFKNTEKNQEGFSSLFMFFWKISRKQAWIMVVISSSFDTDSVIAALLGGACIGLTCVTRTLSFSELLPVSKSRVMTKTCLRSVGVVRRKNNVPGWIIRLNSTHKVCRSPARLLPVQRLVFNLPCYWYAKHDTSELLGGQLVQELHRCRALVGSLPSRFQPAKSGHRRYSCGFGVVTRRGMHLR